MNWEPCTDDGNGWAMSCEGHVWTSDRPLHIAPMLLALGHAVTYETGSGGREAAQILRTAKYSHGYCGTSPDTYDRLPCDEDGISGHCDEDGNETVLSDVEPVTWAWFSE